MRTPHLAILPLLASPMLACGGARNTGDLGQISAGRIWFDSYSVSLPPEQGWHIEVDQGSESVVFIRAGRSVWQAALRGGPPNATLIRVYRNSRNPNLDPLSAEAAADERLDLEIRQMEESDRREQYDLKDATKDTVTIGDWHLYALFYNKSQVPGPDNYMMGESGALYLYFPANFAETQTLYEFFISKLFDPSSTFIASHSRDLPEIQPVIAGFKLSAEEEP